MKTLQDLLPQKNVWVNPSHRIETAIMLMRGYHTSALPVVEGSKLIGIIHYRDLLNADRELPVGELMEKEFAFAGPEITIREAADKMVKEQLDRLPVIDPEGRLMGVISNRDLLAALRQPTDPLTELPWSDTLREWAIDKLQHGVEITLLFLDVDDFGGFNKHYGHVVGDTVLKNIANVLRDVTDEKRDLLCRYGGDEFCIASIRIADEAALLGELIELEVAGLRILEAQGENISLSIGMRGGRRNREREQIHYAATINNLINLASRDCMENKNRRKMTPRKAIRIEDISQDGAADPRISGGSIEGSRISSAKLITDMLTSQTEALVTTPQASRGVSEPDEDSFALRLIHFEVNRAGNNTTVYVELGIRGVITNGLTEGSKYEKGVQSIVYSGEASGEAARDSLDILVGEAALLALRRALPQGCDVRLEEILQIQVADGRVLSAVVGHFISAGSVRPIAGCAIQENDMPRAVIQAILAAVQRKFIQQLKQART